MSTDHRLRIDYLYYGRGLDVLADRLAGLGQLVTRDLLLQGLGGMARRGTEELLSHVGANADDLHVQSVLRAVEDTRRWRAGFRSLRCRGFSYELFRGFEADTASRFQLNIRTNIRMGLVANRQLFYPNGVRGELAKLTRRDNHFIGGMPSIAFALGVRTPDSWYVFVIQSDLASHPSARVREHFRGWRRVLFAHVVAQARESVGRLFLVHPDDLERRPGIPPSSFWAQTYGQTARDWRMSLETLAEPMNIQVLHGRPPVFARRFYRLDLRDPRCNDTQ